MCDFSGRLIAWMDHELPDDEAAEVERHVRACTECGSRVDAYKEVSNRFAAHCDATIESKTRRSLPLWVPALSGAVAGGLLFLVLMRPPVEQIPVLPRVAAPSAIVLETAPKLVRTIYRRRAVAPVKTPDVNWMLVEPAIPIAIPAEAMFPPGAVPEGMNFIAELSIAADGSVEGLRLRP
jgi:anti-sigma factor RsiW